MLRRIPVNSTDIFFVSCSFPLGLCWDVTLDTPPRPLLSTSYLILLLLLVTKLDQYKTCFFLKITTICIYLQDYTASCFISEPINPISVTFDIGKGLSTSYWKGLSTSYCRVNLSFGSYHSIITPLHVHRELSIPCCDLSQVKRF
jgi:hypothetical protein